MNIYVAITEAKKQMAEQARRTKAMLGRCDGESGGHTRGRRFRGMLENPVIHDHGGGAGVPVWRMADGVSGQTLEECRLYSVLCYSERHECTLQMMSIDR